MPGSGAFEASTPLEAQMKPWRVSVTRELARSVRGLDVVELNDPPFDLGDRLLGDDEDVPVLELRALGDQAREVVSLAQLRQVTNREDREAGHRPSIRSPAWPR